MRYSSKMSLSIGRWEVPAKAQMRPPILKLVPRFLQVLDASILRDNLSNLLAHRWRTVKMNLICQIWTHSLCQFREHFPLRTRLTNSRTRNFGAENYSPFSASFGYSPCYFVPRRCRQQHHGVSWLNKHLTGTHNIHVNPQRQTFQGFLHIIR